jgi:short-chain fatty acids transporter
VVEVDPAIDQDSTSASQLNDDLIAENTIASRLNNSRILSWLIGLLGITYVIYHFVDGGSLDLNLINFIILFLGILLLGTPAAYVANLIEGIKTISGIILQYPFYAGIMAASGLVNTISEVFVDVATPQTLPFWGLINSFVINFFAPSTGGHWVIQGFFMIDTVKEIGSALSQTTMAVMLGNA